MNCCSVLAFHGLNQIPFFNPAPSDSETYQLRETGHPGAASVERHQQGKSVPLEDYIVSSPAVSDGKVVVGTLPYYYTWVDPPVDVPDEEHIMCLDETTGKELWYIDPCQGLLSSPCVADGRIFAAIREMLCVDLRKGKIVWNSEEKYPLDFNKPVKERYVFVYSTPALYHGMLVAGSSIGQLSSAEHRRIQWQKIVFMDSYTGDILWEWVEEGVLASSPAVYKGNVYLYSLDGMVRCVSFLEGEERKCTSDRLKESFTV